MFHFFVAQSKVQKDRALMRETDSRMAKYSRRGLVLNFLVFLLCVLFGNFEQQYHNEAIALVCGLLLVTLWRSYFLFRFDELYARAPTRWRNQYFFASCLGAAWWSVILVSLTWMQGMQGETLVMWFYSVVFYSSVANVFAPYRHFLTLYLAIGQIPAAITAIALGDHESVMYGCIMFTFFIMIVHQGKVTSLAYWERLEGIYVLRERAQGLEEEKRTSQAQLQLKNEFLVNLGQEFRASMGDVIGTLALIDEKQLSEQHRELLTVASKAAERQIDLVNNVVDFSKITTRSLALDAVEFDVRRILEKTVQDFSLDAYQQGIEIFYLFDPSMPLRVKGDVQRMNQVINTLMSYALKSSRLDHIYIEARFVQEQEAYGQLQVTISNTEKTAAEDDETHSDSGLLEPGYRGIGLAISKGLAECMDGSVQLREEKNRGLRAFVRLGLGIVAHEEYRFGAEQKFLGKQVLLVDWPQSNAQALAEELQVWGLHVQQAYGREALLARLESSEKKVDLLLLYTRLANLNTLALSAEMASHPAYAGVAQILVMSGLQIDTAEMRQHMRHFPQVAVLEKPVIRKRLYDLMLQRLFNHEARNQELDSPVSLCKVLLVEDHRVDQMVISAMLKKLGCYVQLAKTGPEALDILAEEEFDLLLMDYDMKEQETREAAHKIRTREQDEGSRRLPIVVVTASQLDADEAYLAVGMDDYIAKPIRYDDLENRLQRWLGKH